MSAVRTPLQPRPAFPMTASGCLPTLAQEAAKVGTEPKLLDAACRLNGGKPRQVDIGFVELPACIPEVYRCENGDLHPRSTDPTVQPF